MSYFWLLALTVWLMLPALQPESSTGSPTFSHSSVTAYRPVSGSTPWPSILPSESTPQRLSCMTTVTFLS